SKIGSKVKNKANKIEYETVEMCIYWLASKYFIQGNKDDANKESINEDESSGSNETNSKNKTNNDDELAIDVQNGNQNKKEVLIRPVGHYAMKLHPTSEQRGIFINWVANASLLDRLASLASAYYILVGIFAGISKAAGPCMEDNSLEDWPFIPLLFIWALPIIYVRISNGVVVYKFSEDSFPDQSILVTAFEEKDLHKKRIYVAITALASVALPWLAVIIAYYTPPI
ncbi:29492_t:CDS:2, partial [Racocetra persica]